MVSVHLVNYCSLQLPIGIFSIRDVSRSSSTHAECYYPSQVPGCSDGARVPAVDVLRSQLLLCPSKCRSKQQSCSIRWRPIWYGCRTHRKSHELKSNCLGTYVPPPPGTDITKTSRVYAVSRSAGFGPEVQKRILLGTYALSAEYVKPKIKNHPEC